MRSDAYSPHHRGLARFGRHFLDGKERFTYIGSGSIGGKAHGLARMRGILESSLAESFRPEFDLTIPTLTVIATDHFDAFMKQNDLYEIAYSDADDASIARSFQKADLPVQLVGDLRSMAAEIHTPLAVRSSSMLEDALFEPFASVYATKMIPNNQPGADNRFRKMVEAVKFVYASTFFRDAREYMKATHHNTRDEKMAVIIQEVVGRRYGDRFYPQISGVARSHNFYPTGNARPEEGVVDLALGLGRSIVDEAAGWTYSPAHPQADPPYNSVGDLMKHSQTSFWAVNMGKPPAYDPVNEVEYMVKCGLEDAEYDKTLSQVASTYLPERDRVVMGTGSPGPRIINFAPLLKGGTLPLNRVARELLRTCEEALDSLVEIEFAVSLDPRGVEPACFGFLQVRPMVVSEESVDLPENEMRGEDVLLASNRVMGNGIEEGIRDVVYVKPEAFQVGHTPKMAAELGRINRRLADDGVPYCLIGFGRWGTSDPQGGIPVKFGQISGARVIVEATRPDLDFSLSQGSHFFHNVTSFRILYFSIQHSGDYDIDWECLDRLEAIGETEFIRHVRFSSPLTVKVDGASGRGVIRHDLI
jgi:hypothetical protein